MPRTQGARDKQPRKMHPVSMGNVHAHEPGTISVTLRVNGPEASIRAFAALPSRQRGALIETAISALDSLAETA